MPAPAEPKYSRAEIERRWLAMPEALHRVAGVAPREIEDLYVAGTSLRLRAVRAPGQAAVFKLGRKDGKTAGSMVERVTTIYLGEAEHRLLAMRLPGARIVKRRYALEGGSLDVHDGGEPLLVFEIEFASEAEAARYAPPSFVAVEITGDATWSGAAIAHGAATPRR